MGAFFFLPLVLPLTAWPIARLAERHLHPRATTRLLTCAAAVLALCSTLCLALIMIVGTALLPGNPLPDNWSHPGVRAAVPGDRVAGCVAAVALVAIAVGWGRALRDRRRIVHRVREALAVLPTGPVAVLPDERPYAFTLPGRPERIVVSTGMLHSLTSRERRVLFAHERAHVAGGHHRYLLIAQLAARAHPLLRPLHAAVTYHLERWADEEAARAVGDRRVTARAVGKAALLGPAAGPLPAFAAPGPVPRRVAALLAPPPPSRIWPPTWTPTGLAAYMAAGGAAASAWSSLHAVSALIVILHAAAAS